MEEQNQFIDNLFREGLGDYTESPPPAAWDMLEEKLEKSARKRYPYQWFLLALVSSALVLGVLVSKNPVSITGARQASTDQAATATTPSAGGTATNNNGSATKATSGSNVAANITSGTADGKAVTGTGDNSNDVNNYDKVAGTEHTHQTIDAHVKNITQNTTPVATGGKHALHTHTHTAAGGNTNIMIAATTGKTLKTTATSSTATTNASMPVADAKTAGTEQTTATNNEVAALNQVSSATPSATNRSAAKQRSHKADGSTIDHATAAKAGKNNTADAETVAGNETAANNKTEVAATKQNSTKTASETPAPANVLAAQQQQKTSAVQPVASAQPVGVTTTAQTIPQKVAANDIHELKNRSAFVETVSYIKIDVPSGAANNSGDAAATENAAKTSHWEFGLKGSYESGTKGLLASKYDFAPFIKYNISSKAAIIVQPGIKFASIRNTTLDAGKYYYKTSASYADTQVTYQPLQNQQTYTYNYFESGDSFKVAHKVAQSNFVEFEIPVLFSYQASKNLSILAGVAMTLSKLVGISSETTSDAAYSLKGSVSYTEPTGIQPPSAPGLNGVIYHSASPYLTLANPVYQSQSGSIFGIGYMLGLSYNINTRFLAEAMLQQNLGGLGNIKNGDIKSLYSQPYIRFTIGYRLFGKK